MFPDHFSAPAATRLGQGVHWRNGLSTLVVVLALLLGAPASLIAAPSHAPPPTANTTTFSFALLGDPQIGYGRGGTWGDAARLRKVVDAVNASDVSLAIIPGDLVQSRTFWETRAFEREVARLQPTVLLTAGNHDVVDVQSLAQYRARFGSDYRDFVLGKAAFVLVDSETARSPGLSAKEHERQWRWLEAKLAEHAKRQAHVFLVMHRPPFAHEETEPTSEENWPRETRSRMLELVRRHGVEWILAGHLHRRASLRTHDGIRIEVNPGTSRIFDASPIGYQRFEVTPTLVRSQFFEVAAAPPEPWHVPGVPEWTPRLFEFSPRHWLFTLLYCAAGWLAFKAAARWSSGERSPRAESARFTALLWKAAALVCFVLGANMQLDLDEFVRISGRVLCKAANLEAYRHTITLATMALLVLAATVWLARRYSRSPDGRRASIALAALSGPTLWFMLSAASHHDLGMLFDEGWWDLLNAGALCLVAALAFFDAKPPGARARLHVRAAPPEGVDR